MQSEQPWDLPSNLPQLPLFLTDEEIKSLPPEDIILYIVGIGLINSKKDLKQTFTVEDIKRYISELESNSDLGKPMRAVLIKEDNIVKFLAANTEETEESVGQYKLDDITRLLVSVRIREILKNTPRRKPEPTGLKTLQ